MLQRDYLMQLVSQFIQAMLKTREVAKIHPREAADSLENAMAAAVDMDGALLLSLAPESMASVMQLSGVDEQLAGYLAHALDLEASYLRDAGDTQLAEIRAAQAREITRVYQVDEAEIQRAIDEFE